jgi:parallel beta-helix repeat protein
MENSNNQDIKEAGQVILVNCSNITINSQIISDVFASIIIWNSNFCQMSNNILSDIQFGFLIAYSNDNIIENNEIRNYNFSAINILFSDRNNISLNDIISNSFDFNKFKFQIKSNYDNIINLNNLNVQLEKIVGNKSYKKSELWNSIDSKPLSSLMNNQSIGIYLNSCNSNSIYHNKINKNNDGIKLGKSEFNMIGKNEFKNNNQGIFLDSSSKNNINNNNFIRHNRHAFFNNCRNSWTGNYWNRLRIFPKPIFGKIDIFSFTIPWLNIDWNPAMSPN